MSEYGADKLDEAAKSFEAITKNSIRKILQTSIVRVKFTKSDGTERSMLCTLMEEHLPVKDESKVTKPRKQSEDSIPVFDLENDGWRSFRYDSILEMEFGSAVNKEFGAINDE